MESTNSAVEKPLFSVSYTLDPSIVSDAAAAMDTNRIRHVFTGGMILSILSIILFLMQQPSHYWIYVAISFAVSMLLGFLADNTHRLHLHRLARRGFIVSYTAEPELLRFHVDVYEDSIYSKGPGSIEATHSVSELKNFWCDENTIVMRFTDKKLAVIPRSSMSNSRYLNLIDFLEQHTK